MITAELPVSASADGRVNGYVFACVTMGQRKIYPVCLNLINNRNNKLYEMIYGDCIGAINKGVCPALKMQREEEAAGHAIYFKDRSIDYVIPKLTKTRSRIVTEAVTEAPEPKAMPDNILSRIEDVSYEDALNKAIEKEVKKPAVVVTPEVDGGKIIPMGIAKPGESLIEMARRMLAEKTL